MSTTELSVDSSRREEVSPRRRTISRSSSDTFEVAFGLGPSEAHPDTVKKRSTAAQDVADFMAHSEGEESLEGTPRGGEGEASSSSEVADPPSSLHKQKSRRKSTDKEWRKLDGISKLMRALEDTASTSMTKVPDVFSEEELVILGIMFRAMDRDHDDFLEAADLMGFAEDSGDWAMQSEVEQTIAILDKDKDGVIGFEDYLQFAAGLKMSLLENNKAQLCRDIESLKFKLVRNTS
jgi:hypothetical protein